MIIIENNETKDKYSVDDNEIYINSDKYKEDDENENEYKKNQENKKNEWDDNDNDDKNMIMKIIIEFSN